MVYLVKSCKSKGVNEVKRIIGCLGLMLILAACADNNSTNNDEVNASVQLSENQTTQIDKIEKQKEALQAELEQMQTDLNYKKEEAEYYKQLIVELMKDYSDTQLINVAIQLWDYELQVNGLAVPPNGIVEVHDHSIEISLTEAQPNYEVLPNELLMQGQMSEDYRKQLTANTKPNETNVTDGTVVTGIHHQYEDVAEGTTLTFTLTEQLKQRLGLETTQITIHKR